MRKIILQLAVSLDGYIEGPNGEFDWCFTDQDYGMSEFFKRVDTTFMGRKTYELAVAMESEIPPGFPKMKEYVFSNSLSNAKEGVVLVRGDIKSEVEKIKKEKGRAIWLFGGAELISSLMNLQLVDEIILAVHPVILGSGKALFKEIKERTWLTLNDHKIYPNGLVFLTYTINR
ncbi:MAG TPA: dihydrofolate reductase family protein [Chitinophagaceae bacterium]|nr:dihydrofolate reductase family protein [Chitinophagaceae bacterium]